MIHIPAKVMNNTAIAKAKNVHSKLKKPYITDPKAGPTMRPNPMAASKYDMNFYLSSGNTCPIMENSVV